MPEVKTRAPLKPYPKWLQRFCQWILKLKGWEIRGPIPQIPQFIMLGAPHTSNWDFFTYLLVTIASGIRPYFMGKKDLFNGLMGPIMHALGGIPVDRKSALNVVDQTTEAFKNIPDFKLVIAPEGTREYRPFWKSGFYYMALNSGAPIVMAALNYREKWCRFSEPYTITGDQEKDLNVIRDYYKDAEGLNPKNFSTIVFKEKK